MIHLLFRSALTLVRALGALRVSTRCWTRYRDEHHHWNTQLILLAADGVAMMTKSAPCHPPMKVSRSWKPVGTPLIFLPCAWRASPEFDSGRDHARQTAGPFPRFRRHLPPRSTPTYPSAGETIARKKVQATFTAAILQGTMLKDEYDECPQDHFLSSNHAQRIRQS